jgi:O-antigen/teichoic acid export membrane protein
MKEESVNNKKENFQNHLTNIAKQTGISFMGKILSMGLSFLTVVLLARLLGASSLGRFNLGITIVNLFSIFTILGFDQGLVRFIPIYKSRNNEESLNGLIFSNLLISFFISFSISIFLFINSEFISNKIFNDVKMILVLKYSSVYLIIFTFFRLLGAILKGNKRVDLFTYVVDIITPFSYLILIMGLYKLDNKIFVVYSARIISQVTGIILILALIYKYLFLNIKRINFKLVKFKAYFRFSLPLSFIGLLYYLISNIDKLMLGYFTTSDQIGIYSVSFRVAILTIFLLQSVNSIFASVISELVEKDDYLTLGKLLKNLTKWIFLFGLNFLGLVIILNKEILMVFGEEYFIGGQVLIILTLGQFINAAAGPTGTILIMSGNQKYEVYNSIGVCILNFIMNLYFIPKFGALGAGIATAISITLINILKIMEVYQCFRFHPYNLNYIKVIGSSLISMTIVLILNNYFNIIYYFRLFMSAFIIIIINILILYLLGLEEEDWIIINKIKNKLIK